MDFLGAYATQTQQNKKLRYRDIITAYYDFSTLTTPPTNRDQTGRGNDLTFINSPVIDTPSAGLNCVSASSQYATRAGTTDLYIPNGSFSVGCAFVVTAGANQGLVCNRDIANAAGTAQQFILVYDNATARIQFGVRNAADSGIGLVVSTVPIVAATQYFALGYYDAAAGVLGIRVNGTQTTTGYTGGIYQPNTNPIFYVGSRNGGTFLNGSIRGVLLAKRALTSTQTDLIRNYDGANFGAYWSNIQGLYI